MLDLSLRKVKDAWLQPLVVRCQNVSPIMISLTAFMAGLASAWLAWNTCYYAAVPVWLLSRMLDGLDGAVARYQGKNSDFGGYLDILLDYIVYIAVPLGIALSMPDDLPFIFATALFAIYYVNTGSWMFLSAVLEKRASGATKNREQTSITMPASIIGGSETIITYTLMLLLPQWFLGISALFGILIILSIMHRFSWAMRQLN
jgi:phosphatidylglycerophosphate synthase